MAATLFLLVAGQAAGQATQPGGVPIRPGQFGLVGVATAGLFYVDEPVRDFLQTRRGPAGNAVAGVLRQLGEAHVVYPAALGAWATGWALGEDALERGGAQLLASLTVAAGLTVAGKFAIGRARPAAGVGARSFDGFGGIFSRALPSGHTALAFAFASTLADFTDDGLARAMIYTAAAGTAWSRLNDDKHWLSDVGLGGALGIMSSKLVTGRWTLAGTRGPGRLADRETGSTDLGRLALGAAAGIAIFQGVRMLTSSDEPVAPYLGSAGSGALGAGVQLRF